MNIFGIVVDPIVLAAIMTLVGSGLVAFLTQLIKNGLHLEGTKAVILTGAVAVVTTAVYFLFLSGIHPFPIIQFVVYAVVVFGEATGYYHFAGPVLLKRKK